MTISVVQTATGTSFPLSFSSAVTPGNTVIAVVDMIQSGYPVVAGPTLGGSAPAGAYPIWNDAGNSNAVIQTGLTCATTAWVLPNCPGANGVDFATKNISANVGVILYEVAGLGPSPVVNVSSEANDVSGNAALDSGTIVPTVGPALILGCCANYSSSGVGSSGFTNANASGNGWAGYQIASAPGGSYAWSIPAINSNGWVAGVAAIVGNAPANTGGMFFA